MCWSALDLLHYSDKGKALGEVKVRHNDVRTQWYSEKVKAIKIQACYEKTESAGKSSCYVGDSLVEDDLDGVAWRSLNDPFTVKGLLV